MRWGTDLSQGLVVGVWHSSEPSLFGAIGHIQIDMLQKVKVTWILITDFSNQTIHAIEWLQIAHFPS